MSRRNKLLKFQSLATYSNVYQNPNASTSDLYWHTNQKVNHKGAWSQNHFKNNHPITLELACGGGEYTLALSKLHPSKNHIGIDIKGARIWKGAKKALEQNITNAAFIRSRIENITNYFAENEISQIWITFPDPFLKATKAKRRLTSPLFLNLYKSILKPNGTINLKTDDRTLYQYSLETINKHSDSILIHQHEDIYQENYPITQELNIKTYYEYKHLEKNKTIKYVKFGFK